MRVAVVGNLGGYGHLTAAYLRRLGVDAHVFIGVHEPGQADPGWDGPGVLDAAAPWVHRWGLPGFDHTYPPGPAGLGERLRRRAALLPLARALGRFAVVVAYAGGPSGLYRWIGRPYLLHANGSDLREVAVADGAAGRRMRRAYRGAGAVLLLNLDMVRVVRRLRLPHAHFMPFAIDTDRFRPLPGGRSTDGALHILHPSHLDWTYRGMARTSTKGNDRFLRALARAVRRGVRAHAVVLERGPDVEATKRLVGELGLQDHVTFRSELRRPDLIRAMQEADLVADQFDVGAFGTTALEAMACGAPLLTYIDAEAAALCYADAPPVLNARTEEEIAARLKAWADPAVRRAHAEAGRAWVEKYHRWDRAMEHLVHHIETLVGPGVRTLRQSPSPAVPAKADAEEHPGPAMGISERGARSQQATPKGAETHMPDEHEPLIRHLVCPGCAEKLSATIFQGTEAIVREGLLTCGGCGVRYPIVAGIPRMLPDALGRHRAWAVAHNVPLPDGSWETSPVTTQAPESVRCFGVEWTRHPRPYPPDKLRQAVLGQTGLPAEDFRGRLVLDAGCGHGSQAAFMADLGARVIGVDLSPDAAGVAWEKIGRDERGLVIQADLARLPFPDRLFDLIYSEGVLHHTRDPQASFRHLVRKVRPSGYIAAGFYLKPSWWTGRLRLWANDLVRRALRPFPTSVVRGLTFFSAPLAKIPLLGAVAKRTFVFWDPENRGWRETWMLNFDWYGTHSYQYYFTEDEVLGLFTDPALGLRDLFRGKPNFFRATVGAPAQAAAGPAAVFGSLP